MIFVDLSVGKIFEFLFGNAEDSFIAANPEIIFLIFKNLKNAVVEKSAFHRVIKKFPVAKTTQTAVVSADPQSSVRVFVDRPNAIARQTIGWS